MVMPRSRSMSMESSTCSTISRSASAPVSWISRSARVDLPWSICAMIAKLRILSMAAFMAGGLAFGVSGSKHVWRVGANSEGRVAEAPIRYSPALLRRLALLGQERLEHDRLARLRHDRVAGRHRFPVTALAIERLGDH